MGDKLMWIFLNNAFLSIVIDRQSNEGNLLVRARRKGDIEAVFPRAKVTVNAKRDYRFRASIRRQDVASAIADSICGISYDNFKDSIPKKDHERHTAYLRVWSTMEQFQRPRRLPERFDWPRNDIDPTWGGR